MMNAKTKLLLKWLNKERKLIYRIYALAFLQGALYIAIPLVIQGMITYVMAGKFSASLFLLCSLVISITLLIGFFQLWQMRLNETLHEKIFCNLTDRLAQLTLTHQESKKKIVHYFEVVTLQKGIGKVLLEFSFSVISIVFGILLLPAYSNWFFIFSVLLGITFFLIITYYGKKAQEENIHTSTHKYEIFDILSSENTRLSEVDAALDHYLDHRKIYYSTFERQYKGILFFKFFFISILLFVGAYLVQHGELNIGQFVASEIIILLVINAVEKLIGSMGTFYDMITGLYKLELLFSHNPSESYLESEARPTLSSTTRIYRNRYSHWVKAIVYTVLFSCIVILFLPWTQTVKMEGEVSVLNPENKPQQVTSRIAGRIEKWYIKDGDFVKKNDTIAFISEIKEEYMDSLLVQRSEDQVKAKEISIASYENKVAAIDKQIDAINKALYLKTEQVKNKIEQSKAKLASDIADSEAALNNYKVTEEQFKRFEELFAKGVISKTDLENRKIKVQEAFAKKIAAENKIIAAKNDLLNNEIELNSTLQEYTEKLTKTESEKFATISMRYESEGMLTKLQNQLSNYSLRNTYYFVLAPRDGYISNIAMQGVGEIVKEGGMLCNVAPLKIEQAVELFVDPVDLPLVAKGQRVQLIFDGWPAFVFSGWPGISYGSFSAEVVAFDKVISPNGKFRVLAVNKGEPWPMAIQLGGGAKGLALLSNVPVVYELWRKANGFPPEFYLSNKEKIDHELTSKK